MVSGEFLQRPELRGLWNFTAWLESAKAEPSDAFAVAARKLYAKDVKVRESANAIIDNKDPENPVRVFADSC